MRAENVLKENNSSSFLSSSYSPALIMQCEKLLSVVLNRTAFLNNQQLTPPYIRQLLAKQNLTLRLPKTIPECVIELHRLINSTTEIEISKKKTEQNYGIQERSRSLIVFVFLIACVSLISIIGNLCLAKVLYSKRFRLLQTDRIVLCLALSELCLVLIDSPTEIYRFLSYSFSQTWLCRFHTFFESLFSSCIIFYHLLGAFDRFVYIHGHTSSTISSWSKWCRRAATKSGSILLLILPILCSLPIAICNVLHAHVLHTSSQMKICIVQYTHQILISFLIAFYILPILVSFFLHGKLIYFIRTRHHQHYLTGATTTTTTTTATTTSYMVPLKRMNMSDSQILTQKQQRTTNPTILSHHHHHHHQEQLLQPKTTKTKGRRSVMFNTDTVRNAAGMIMSTTMTAAGQQAGANNSSNSSGSSRSSNGTSFTSITSPIILYKINSQANANARRTVLLLVLLLSFYVLCWAPYNIYTWTHAYQLTTNIPNEIPFNRTFFFDINQTISSFTDSLHADLRRIIFINYSLYLLSMISMCFSFLFYFSLNKQARREFTTTIGCMCPWLVNFCHCNQRKDNLRHIYGRPEGLQYHARYQLHYPQNTPMLSPTKPNTQRLKTIKFKTHSTYVPPVPLHIDRQNTKKYVNASQTKLDHLSSKRTALAYGCHIQCCP